MSTGRMRSGSSAGSGVAGRSNEPAYMQTTEALRELALSCPWSDDGLIPSEGSLMELFGVSRGTLRRASDELTREGLLRPAPGRGTFVNRRAQVRAIARDTLTAIAKPDSRWHLNVDEFVPAFDGVDAAIERIRGLDAYRTAAIVFITPDNSTEQMRLRALTDGKTVIVSTFGQRRGMVALRPDKIEASRHELAATLDGMERCGDALTIDDLRALSRVDLMITGAFAVTRAGVHVDSEADYFDFEWQILAELGLVRQSTPVAAIVHPAQVIDVPLQLESFETTVDLIITPDAVTPTNGQFVRPTGVSWRDIEPHMLEVSPYLAALSARRAPSGPAVLPAQASWADLVERTDRRD